jgi:hypothetical protein
MSHQIYWYFLRAESRRVGIYAHRRTCPFDDLLSSYRWARAHSTVKSFRLGLNTNGLLQSFSKRFFIYVRDKGVDCFHLGRRLMELDGDREVPNYTKAEAISIVYQCVLGLAVVVSLVVPASMQNRDDKMSAFQFYQSLAYAEQSVTRHRRSVFEGRRLALASRVDAARHLVAPVPATKLHN